MITSPRCNFPRASDATTWNKHFRAFFKAESFGRDSAPEILPSCQVATHPQMQRDPEIIARVAGSSAHSTRSLLAKDGRIEFANLQIGFQLAYYRVRLFRLKAGGKGINVDTPRKAGGLLQRPVSHCLRCCAPLCIQPPPNPRLSPPGLLPAAAQRRSPRSLGRERAARYVDVKY